MSGRRRTARRCGGCGAALPPGSRASRRYCSDACRTAAWRARRRHFRVYDAVLAEVAELGLARGPSERELRERKYPRRRCPVCRATWLAGLHKRADAVYCSARCRTAAWRERSGYVPGWLTKLREQ